MANDCEFSNLSAQVHNKNRTSEPSMKLFVYFIRTEMRDKHLTLTVTASQSQTNNLEAKYSSLKTDFLPFVSFLFFLNTE